MLTATSALLRFQPVANALISGESKIATSGNPMPAFSAWRFTVSTSQRSVMFDGTSITWAPVIIFALHFDIRSEMNEPPKPITAANINNALKLIPTPCSSSIRSTPSSCRVTLSTSTMARLVTRYRKIRFIKPLSSWVVASLH